jgi:hypothetical protein
MANSLALLTSTISAGLGRSAARQVAQNTTMHERVGSFMRGALYSCIKDGFDQPRPRLRNLLVKNGWNRKILKKSAACVAVLQTL